MIKSKSSNQSMFTKSLNLSIFTENGNQISFKSLFENQKNQISKILIIFIRHFFCGNCQEYIRRLNEIIPPSKLPQNLSIIIIGCGTSSLISSYIQITNCLYPIYADPSHQLYDNFGMYRSLSLGSKSPKYIQHSLLSGILKSMVQGLKRIPSGDVMSAGDLNINGGEFLFLKQNQSNSNWLLSWYHCMENSRDHTEIEELKQILDLKQIQISSQKLHRSFSTKSYHWIIRVNSFGRSNLSSKSKNL